MTSPDLIIFDCDGVLIDSEPLASRTLSEALCSVGVELSPLDVHMLFTGKAESDIRRVCAQTYGLTEVDAVFSAWHEALYAAFALDLQPMEGMIGLVRSLTTAKCVASNSRHERLSASLGRTPLWLEFGQHIYGADSVARPKPAPDLLLHCAKMLDVDPARSVMIDDSPHGIAAAIAARMVPIGFVDPQDLRPERATALRVAGALHVAMGAVDLTSILGDLGCTIDKRLELKAAYHG